MYDLEQDPELERLDREAERRELRAMRAIAFVAGLAALLLLSSVIVYVFIQPEVWRPAYEQPAQGFGLRR